MCQLCNIKKKTHWYYQDNDFVICDCVLCKIPMVVIRDHVMVLPLKVLIKIVNVIKNEFGENVKLRTDQRNILDHWHIHIIK